MNGWGYAPDLRCRGHGAAAHLLDMFYIAGPGHGGPAIVSNVYLEGTYTEIYPNITQDEDGMKKTV